MLIYQNSCSNVRIASYTFEYIWWNILVLSQASFSQAIATDYWLVVPRLNLFLHSFYTCEHVIMFMLKCLKERFLKKIVYMYVIEVTLDDIVRSSLSIYVSLPSFGCFCCYSITTSSSLFFLFSLFVWRKPSTVLTMYIICSQYIKIYHLYNKFIFLKQLCLNFSTKM